MCEGLSGSIEPLNDNETTEEADTGNLLGLKIATNFGVGRSVMMKMMMMMITMLATYYPMLGLACFTLRVVISFMKTVLKNWYSLYVSVSLYIIGLLLRGEGNEADITRVFII
jgi:hypothetical protein